MKSPRNNLVEYTMTVGDYGKLLLNRIKNYLPSAKLDADKGVINFSFGLGREKEHYKVVIKDDAIDLFRVSEKGRKIGVNYGWNWSFARHSACVNICSVAGAISWDKKGNPMKQRYGKWIRADKKHEPVRVREIAGMFRGRA